MEEINIRNENLKRSFLSKGFKKLTDIQNLVVRNKNSGKDLLVTSETGSGKTLAYCLSISEDILNKDSLHQSSPSGLIITPTRELALQVFKEAKSLYQFENVKIFTAIGGMDVKKEKQNISKKFHLLIGTPGRINDHLRRKYLNLSNLSVMVLDEADEILDLGFREDLNKIINHSPKNTRKLMFSATLPKKVIELANKYQNKPIKIETINNSKPHSDILYESYFLNKRDVENAIFNLVRYHDNKNIIIFCATRISVTHIQSRLQNRGVNVVSLSGALNQEERFKALQSMKNERCRVCVATDVAARGIDLVNLDIVIHADLPRNSDGLLHRSGRTGRAGKKGLTIMFFSPNEVNHYERLVLNSGVIPHLKKFITRKEIENKDHDQILNEISKKIEIDSNEEQLLDKILKKVSAKEIGKAYIKKFKDKLTPIEDVEEISLKLTEFKKDNKRKRFSSDSKNNKRRKNIKNRSRRNR